MEQQREGWSILDHSLRTELIIAGKAQKQDPETTSTVREQRDAGAQLAFHFHFQSCDFHGHITGYTWQALSSHFYL